MNKLIFILPLFLSACMNMPTECAQITPSHISGIQYEYMTCNQLNRELDSLSRREGDLVTAQTQRYKTSQVQAFWMGYGQGDGIEASELSHVRGEKEAIIDRLSLKGCK